MNNAAALSPNKRAYLDIANRGVVGRDYRAIDDNVAAGYRGHEPIGNREGPAAMKATYQRFHAAFEHIRYAVLDLVEEGDTVMSRWVFFGRQVNEFDGVPSAGRWVCLPALSMVRFNAEHKIVHNVIQWDRAALHAQMRAPIVHKKTLKNTTLAYTKTGSGKPIYVLHGGPGLDATSLRPWLDSLGHLGELHFIDLRGNGRSDRATQVAAFDDYVDDLDALRDELGHDRVVVIGHSFGGYVAQRWAQKHPKNLRGLLLSSTAAKNDFAMPDAVTAAMAAHPLTSDAGFQTLWHKVLSTYLPHSKQDFADAVFAETRFSLAAMGAGFGVVSAYDAVKNGYDGPALVVVGDSDHVTTEEQADRVVSAIGGAEKVVIEGAGHFPFVENPRDFLLAAEKFLLRC